MFDSVTNKKKRHRNTYLVFCQRLRSATEKPEKIETYVNYLCDCPFFIIKLKFFVQWLLPCSHLLIGNNIGIVKILKHRKKRRRILNETIFKTKNCQNSIILRIKMNHCSKFTNLFQKSFIDGNIMLFPELAIKNWISYDKILFRSICGE